MLHRLQLSSPRASKSLQTRVGFPLQDNSVRGMERYFTKWPRFLQQRITKEYTKNARLLATIQRGNTAEWDCSCLFLAILYSDCIGSTLSPAVRKEVDNLRQVRNDIAHLNEVELTDAEFHNNVARVLAAFNSLKLPINEVDDIKNQTDFPTAEVNSLKMQADNLKAELKTKEQENKNLTSELQSTQATLQTKQEEVETLTQEINSKVDSFCTLTFKPSHEIIKRSSDVKRIMKKLDELYNESNGAISTIYLSGIPGCGKSQLARQLGQDIFDRRLHENDSLTFVATLNTETLDSLAESYSRLARHLGITEYTLTNLETSTKGNPREKIQYLKRAIYPKTKHFSNWLIIADNVVDLSLVSRDLPPTGSEEWGHGQVLITTQDSSSIPSNAPLTYHESISKGMHPDDAVNLLRQVSQIQDQNQDKKVAEVLEYQPLALAAAAFYVQTIVVSGSPNYHWKDYLEALSHGEREATEKLLANQNIAYSETTTTAIQMAIMRALESDDVLREVLHLFSLCAPESLPMEVAVDFVKLRITGETEELIKTKLFKASLLSCLQDKDGKYPFLRMHNIVHEVLKVVITSKIDATDRIQCISIVIEIFQSLMEKNRNLLHSSRHVFAKLRLITSHCKELHVIVNTDFTKSNMFLNSITPRKLVLWLSLTADVCRSLSNPSDAYLFNTSICNFMHFLNNFKEDKLLKANTYNIQGNVHRNLGQYSEAKEYYEKALIIRKEIYGEHHGDVAASYNNLGTVYSDLGQYGEAKENHEKALIIRKEIFGEHHAKVAGSYNNLGTVYGDLGQYSEARENYEKALIIIKKIYGEHHGNVAGIYNNLGTVYSHLGQYREAKENHDKALIIRKEIYGEHHGDVAASYYNLGTVYSDLGQYSEAKGNHEKALIIRREIYGEHHGDVAASYNNLGIVYSDLGQYSEAKENHEKALIIRKEIYGEHHGDVATSYDNLGTVYSDLGQYSEAKENHEKGLIIRKEIYGEHHGVVAGSYNNLGIVYNDLGQYNEAKENHDKALIIRKEIYGEHHGDVAASYNNLGTVYSHLGQYSEAKENFEKALIIRKEIYGEHQGVVAASYNNLGIVYKFLGRYSEAKENHEKALIIGKEIYGEHHGDVATSYDNLGTVYSHLGQYSKAKEYYEKALIIRKEIYGEHHGVVAGSYNNLGTVYSDLGQNSEAKENHENALIITKEIYGEHHGDVAASYNNLGIVYTNLGQYSEAKEYYEKALIIRKEIYGEHHGNVVASYNSLGNVYIFLGQYNEAKENYEKALIIRKEIYGEHHGDVAASYNNLGNVYIFLGQYNEAKENYEKALIIGKEIYATLS